MLLEQLIAAHLDRAVSGDGGPGRLAFRVTRDTDIEIREEEADDLLEVGERAPAALRRRVRLEVEAAARSTSAGCCGRSSSWTTEDVYESTGPSASRLMSIVGSTGPI